MFSSSLHFDHVFQQSFPLGSDGLPTDQEPSESDVYSEFDQWRRKSNIKSWMGKFVGRKYVFDDCEPGIDPELQYLKAVYGFNGMVALVTSI